MKIAFIIYNNMTALDFLGIFDPVTRLKTMGFIEDFEYHVCGIDKNVKSYAGLNFIPDKVKNDLSIYDYIIFPGGRGVKNIVENKDFINWFNSISNSTKLCSVCGGSIILGALGKLKNKRATTHPILKGYLKHYTDRISDDRIVEDGNVITARGVTSAIDLGLYLCEKIAGEDVRLKIQTQMDYLNYNF